MIDEKSFKYTEEVQKYLDEYNSFKEVIPIILFLEELFYILKFN